MQNMMLLSILVKQRKEGINDKIKWIVIRNFENEKYEKNDEK